MNEVINILEEMQQECEGANRGLQIVQYAKVYRFATKKEHASYYQKLIDTPTVLHSHKPPRNFSDCCISPTDHKD